jgi:hypothetical protein
MQKTRQDKKARSERRRSSRITPALCGPCRGDIIQGRTRPVSHVILFCDVFTSHGINDIWRPVGPRQQTPPRHRLRWSRHNASRKWPVRDFKSIRTRKAMSVPEPIHRPITLSPADHISCE